MANNCLQTKLKSVVANDNLEKINELVLKDFLGNVDNTTLTTSYCTIDATGVLGYSNNNPVSFPWQSYNASVLKLTTDGVSSEHRISIMGINDSASFGSMNGKLHKGLDSLHLVKSVLTLISFNTSTFDEDQDLLFFSDCSLNTFSLVDTNIAGDAKQLINKMAENRTSGEMETALKGSKITNIPTGIGNSYATRGIVYFSSNPAYPGGWYVKAIDGTYYDSNGNVITPVE